MVAYTRVMLGEIVRNIDRRVGERFRCKIVKP